MNGKPQSVTEADAVAPLLSEQRLDAGGDHAPGSAARDRAASPVALTDGIRLLSGALFDYADPAACAVEIGDIAGALSKVCRFAGHIRHFYSVAQHAVNVSRIVPPSHAFTALMHDTAEAFTNDLPTPLKAAFPAFRILEARIESAMAARFGFTFPLPEDVRRADLIMLAVEKAELKGDDSRWAVLDEVSVAEIFAGTVAADLRPLTPSEAEQLFLDRYRELKGC